MKTDKIIVSKKIALDILAKVQYPLGIYFSMSDETPLLNMSFVINDRIIYGLLEQSQYDIIKLLLDTNVISENNDIKYIIFMRALRDNERDFLYYLINNNNFLKDLDIKKYSFEKIFKTLNIKIILFFINHEDFVCDDHAFKKYIIKSYKANCFLHLNKKQFKQLKRYEKIILEPKYLNVNDINKMLKYSDTGYLYYGDCMIYLLRYYYINKRNNLYNILSDILKHNYPNDIIKIIINYRVKYNYAKF